MSNRIPTPTMGEILMEEFMGPMNLSAYKLAQSIHVPTSRIQDILHNRRKISADTSIRLGRLEISPRLSRILPSPCNSAWQHFGNRKSDSPCFMDNQWNQNTRSHRT